MTDFNERIARRTALTEVLSVIDLTLGDQPPSRQAMAIISAVKKMREIDMPVTVTAHIDYLEQVQERARSAWIEAHGWKPPTPGLEASVMIETPAGNLRATVWRRAWHGVRGEREVWCSAYELDGEHITIHEMRQMGLNRRPTTRNRSRHRG